MPLAELGVVITRGYAVPPVPVPNDPVTLAVIDVLSVLAVPVPAPLVGVEVTRAVMLLAKPAAGAVPVRASTAIRIRGDGVSASPLAAVPTADAVLATAVVTPLAEVVPPLAVPIP